MRTIVRMSTLIAAVCGLVLLAGCGIKGPLYVPQVPKPAAKPAPADDHNKPVPKDSAQ